jgi:hypothetical protein
VRLFRGPGRGAFADELDRRRSDPSFNLEYLTSEELLALQRIVRALKTRGLEEGEQSRLDDLRWRARRRGEVALDVGICIGHSPAGCECLARAFDESPEADRESILVRARELHAREGRRRAARAAKRAAKALPLFEAETRERQVKAGREHGRGIASGARATSYRSREQAGAPAESAPAEPEPPPPPRRTRPRAPEVVSARAWRSKASRSEQSVAAELLDKLF